MIRLLLARARCALTTHVWPAWDPWKFTVAARHVHRRRCVRCGARGVAVDGRVH